MPSPRSIDRTRRVFRRVSDQLVGEANRREEDACVFQVWFGTRTLAPDPAEGKLIGKSCLVSVDRLCVGCLRVLTAVVCLRQRDFGPEAPQHTSKVRVAFFDEIGRIQSNRTSALFSLVWRLPV